LKHLNFENSDIFVHWKAPDHVEFGHIAESPSDWEQRFEKKQGHRQQGKVSSFEIDNGTPKSMKFKEI
jgi:hypothetical protein